MSVMFTVTGGGAGHDTVVAMPYGTCLGLNAVGKLTQVPFAAPSVTYRYQSAAGNAIGPVREASMLTATDPAALPGQVDNGPATLLRSRAQRVPAGAWLPLSLIHISEP